MNVSPGSLVPESKALETPTADTSVHPDLFRPKRRRCPWVLGFALVLAGMLHGVLPEAKTFSSNRHRWVAPLVLSSTDPRVVEIAATLRRETTRRTELSDQKGNLERRLREVEREIQLAETMPPARPTTRRAVANRGLVGRSASHDQEHDASTVTIAKNRALAASLRTELVDTEQSLKENQEQLAALRQSPYSSAISGDVTLAFVPDDHRDAIDVGDSLVTCSVGIFMCRRVGWIVELMAGEAKVTSSSPNEPPLRGHLVRLDVDERLALQHSVLYAERNEP